MSHISIVIAKLSLLCRTISIQINTGEKDCGGRWGGSFTGWEFVLGGKGHREMTWGPGGGGGRRRGESPHVP